MVFDHICPGLLDISVRTRGQPNFRNRTVDLLEFVLLPDIYLRVRLPRVRTKIRYVRSGVIYDEAKRMKIAVGIMKSILRSGCL